MFKKKKSADPELVDEVIKHLQGNQQLYKFQHVYISSDYRFAIAFPDIPIEEEVDDAEGRIHHFTTPDSITYSVLALQIEDEHDKDAVANAIMDGITDSPEWHEYSDRELTTVDRGQTALTQTFVSDSNTFLINTTLYTNKYLYSIQVQNVYIEHAVTKLSSFIDTFRLLPDR